jgi:hypothetical protein
MQAGPEAPPYVMIALDLDLMPGAYAICRWPAGEELQHVFGGP